MLILLICSLLLCGASAKWDADSLKVLTNEVNSEVLNYYSNLPNKVTDLALECVRDYLVHNNDTKVGIPPLDVKFTVPFLGFDLIDGDFKATNGIFVNPATIERRGNSTIRYHFFQANISTSIGFTDMEVYFPSYEATALGIHENGDVRVIVGTNEILMQVSVLMQWGKCTISLSKLKITKFDQITTNISGLSILDSLANYITSWVLSSYETSLTSLIENIVANKLAEALAKSGGFCKYKRTLTNTENAPHRNIFCRQVPKDNKTVYKCHEKNAAVNVS